MRSLSHNILGAEGAAALAPALAANGGLTSFNLSGNNLTHYGRDMTGITELATALGINVRLMALDLSFNYLKDEGVSAVCEAIQSNKETKLTSLNFGYSGIGPVGANAVAAMLVVTGSLTSLNLGHNQLCGLDEYGRGTYTADGITAIADALRVNGSLTKMRYVTPQTNLSEFGSARPHCTSWCMRAMRDGLCTTLAFTFAFASSALV